MRFQSGINIIIIQITSIKYDITLTTLSFFIFSNVLPHDITKNPVKFCFSSQIFLENFKTKDSSRAFFREGLIAKFRAVFAKNTRLSKISPLKLATLLAIYFSTDSDYKNNRFPGVFFQCKDNL